VRSECHAWGAFPLYEFPRTLLGVRPGAPGWKEILINPFYGIAPDCKGTVTTPAGGVAVEWKKSGVKIKLKIQSPAGTPCAVTLPDGSVKKLPDGGSVEY